MINGFQQMWAEIKIYGTMHCTVHVLPRFYHVKRSVVKKRNYWIMQDIYIRNEEHYYGINILNMYCTEGHNKIYLLMLLLGKYK